MVKNIVDNKFSRYEDRQKAKGLKKKHPWIPIEDEKKFDAYCARLRKNHANKVES